MFLQRMYLTIILGVLLIILLSIFVNLIDHELYLQCGDNNNPLQQLVTHVGTNDHMYHPYLKMSSPPQIKSVINQLGVTNLTLQGSHVSFLSCGGRLLLKQLKGKQPNSSVHIPSSFHRCKNMSFKSSGPSIALASYPGSGNSCMGSSTTGISYRHLHWCCILRSSIS